jgi:hypothetical protein
MSYLRDVLGAPSKTAPKDFARTKALPQKLSRIGEQKAHLIQQRLAWLRINRG